MKNHTIHIIIALTTALGTLGLAGCGVDSAPQTDSAAQESGLSCTPNAQKCDPGCTFDGGPANEDCRLVCTPGHVWITVESCGTGHCVKQGFTTQCVP